MNHEHLSLLINAQTLLHLIVPLVLSVLQHNILRFFTNIGKDCYSVIEMSWPYLESSVFYLTQVFYLTHCCMLHKRSFAKFSSAGS